MIKTAEHYVYIQGHSANSQIEQERENRTTIQGNFWIPSCTLLLGGIRLLTIMPSERNFLLIGSPPIYKAILSKAGAQKYLKPTNIDLEIDDAVCNLHQQRIIFRYFCTEELIITFIGQLHNLWKWN